MINLTKSFYVKIIQLLMSRIETFKNDITEWDKCMRDINFVSSMYRFPHPTVSQMEVILNICDKIDLPITDINGQRIRNIQDYKRYLKIQESTNDSV